MRAKRRKIEAAEEARFQLRRTVNTGLLERAKARLELLRNEPEQGHGLEDLAEPVPPKGQDGGDG